MKNRIREIRESRGLSQKELAVSLDVTQAIISKIESDKQSMTDKQMSAIAKVLEVHPADLIDDQDWNRLPLSRLNEPLLKIICKIILKLMKKNSGIDENMMSEVITSLYRRYASQAAASKDQTKTIEDVADILVGHELAKRD